MAERVDANDWIRLCELLDDDPELVPAMRQGIESADDADLWTILIDGLDDAGALAYLDREDSGVELADALPQIPRIFAAGVDLDEVGDVDGDLIAAITRADSILAAHDLRIVYLDEESDSYPLVVVPVSHVSEIIEITTRLGFTAKVFSLHRRVSATRMIVSWPSS